MIFFLKYFKSKYNPCLNPKRGAFNLNFCWCNNTQFLRGNRRDPNLVPLEKSSKLHRQKLRSNAPLFGLFWRCLFDTTEVKHTVYIIWKNFQNTTPRKSVFKYTTQLIIGLFYFTTPDVSFCYTPWLYLSHICLLSCTRIAILTGTHSFNHTFDIPYFITQQDSKNQFQFKHRCSEAYHF